MPKIHSLISQFKFYEKSLADFLMWFDLGDMFFHMQLAAELGDTDHLQYLARKALFSLPYGPELGGHYTLKEIGNVTDR